MVKFWLSRRVVESPLCRAPRTSNSFTISSLSGSFPAFSDART